MSEAKHTPGPWYPAWGGSPEHGSMVVRWPVTIDSENRICTIGEASDNQQSDAHLIAAAPDLLEALKETRQALMAAMRWLAANDSEDSILVDGWLEECQRLGIPNGVGKRSEAAIAKAEGR